MITEITKQDILDLFQNGLKDSDIFDTKTIKYCYCGRLNQVEFLNYETIADRFEPVRKEMVVCDLPYPQMKMLDMGFWKIGFDLDTGKGLKVPH